jgi:acetylornithine deacetylase/succinyl-diaminopimelate desuccinylase-like protein
MKSAVAQMAIALIGAASAQRAPAGDVVFVAFSDEEGGSEFGARFILERHAELLDGVRYAIGEFGGFSTYIRGQRFYPSRSAKSSGVELRLSVRGRSGHGSVPVRGGAMARLGELLTRLDSQRLPVHG